MQSWCRKHKDVAGVVNKLHKPGVGGGGHGH